MASSMGIYVRILSPVVPSSMHQTPGFKSGVWCHATGRLLYRLSCTKDLASSYGVDVKILSDSCNLACTKTCHQARLLCQDTAGPLFSPVRILITGDTSKQSFIGKLLPSSYKKNKLSIWILWTLGGGGGGGGGGLGLGWGEKLNL